MGAKQVTAPCAVICSCLLAAVWLISIADCCDLQQLTAAGRTMQSIELRMRQSQVVFRGLTTNVYGSAVVVSAPDAAAAEDWLSGRRVPAEDALSATARRRDDVRQPPPYHSDIRGVFTAYFELINTYKGDATLALWDSNRYSGLRRRVNVTFFEESTECQPTSGVPREYIVFCELQGSDLEAISVVQWTEESELRVWNALGWGVWSDWSACSVSCGSGIQQRSRLCQVHDCPGPNIEQRLCNLFSCAVAVNPLALEDRRFFHPSRSQWARVPERPDAWRLQPNAYIWVPVSQVFPGHATMDPKSPFGIFPKEFTVFVTLRIQNDTTMGTLWSLRSRRQQDAYLSLELAGTLGVNLVHANGANGTDVVRIPTNLGDGMWHHLALGIRDDSTVNTFVDCEWLRTDILKKDALNTPEDADLIIGYLFTGDLEQLVIVSNADAVNQQCSPTRTPIADPSLESRIPHTKKAPTSKPAAEHRNTDPTQSELTDTQKLSMDFPPEVEKSADPISEMSTSTIHGEYDTLTSTRSSEKMNEHIHRNIVGKKMPRIQDGNVEFRNSTKRNRKGKKGHHHKKNKKKIRKQMQDTLEIVQE